MQRLHFNIDEKISRKEYLKRKKKQSNELKRTSKITYILIGLTSFLTIYLLFQFYLYKEYNNYSYVADKNVDSQKVYKLYYVTAGYTYDPKFTLNSVESDGFNDKIVVKDVGFSKIISKHDYVYGIKDNGLYRINKKTNEVETLVEKDVLKFTIFDNEIYAISSDSKKVTKIDVASKETKEMAFDKIGEILVDKDKIYLTIQNGQKYDLYSFDKDGTNKIQITKNSDVHLMVQNDNKILYINKSDSSKIYWVSKDGSNEEKFYDLSCEEYSYDDSTIDGSRYMFVNTENFFFVNEKESDNLWKVNIAQKTAENVLKMGIELLQHIDNTVFFKAEYEHGVYLYNYDSQFLSFVTKSKIVEFYADDEPIDTNNRVNTLNRN